MAKLHAAIDADATGSEALDLFDGLIAQVSVKPLENGTGMKIELIGDKAAMVSLASGSVGARTRHR